MIVGPVESGTDAHAPILPTESLIHPRAGFRGWTLCGVEGDISETKTEREKGGKKENEKERERGETIGMTCNMQERESQNKNKFKTHILGSFSGGDIPMRSYAVSQTL